MLMFFGFLAAAIAAGLIIYQIVKFTVKWIVNIVKRLSNRGAKKTLVSDINAMIESCDNVKSLDALEKLADEGYTHIMAGVDSQNNLVDDVMIIKDEDDEIPYEVTQLLGEEKSVVIGV